MGTSLTPSEANNWSMAAHMSALLGILFVPGLVLGPLVVWLLKRNDSEVVNANGKEALNFQLTVLLTTFVLAILSSVSTLFSGAALLVGVAGCGFAVYAGLAAKKGQQYRYPVALRMIK